ncbi:MAG: HIT domain-containing protein [Chloroflexota bacterium]
MMHNHAGDDYDCPFCKLVRGEDDDGDWTKQSEIFLRTEHIAAFVSPLWYPNNNGHVIIIPTKHIENIYTLPRELGGHMLEAAKYISIAFREIYEATGTSLRQHNEPDGFQDIFHYHMEVFPRYKEDRLYSYVRHGRMTSVKEREPYTNKMRTYFEQKYSGKEK